MRALMRAMSTGPFSTTSFVYSSIFDVHITPIFAHIRRRIDGRPACRDRIHVLVSGRPLLLRIVLEIDTLRLYLRLVIVFLASVALLDAQQY